MAFYDGIGDVLYNDFVHEPPLSRAKINGMAFPPEDCNTPRPHKYAYNLLQT